MEALNIIIQCHEMVKVSRIFKGVVRAIEADHQATFADPSSAVQHNKFVFSRMISIIQHSQFVFPAHKHERSPHAKLIIRKQLYSNFVCGILYRNQGVKADPLENSHLAGVEIASRFYKSRYGSNDSQ